MHLIKKTKYYIYHVYGVKIGCTNNPQRRIEQEQGYTKDEYHIVKVCSDISEASKIERELQILYNKCRNYRIDAYTYESIIKTNEYKRLFY